MAENVSVDLWPLHAYTSANIYTNMYTTIVKNASYSVSIPLNSQLSLPSSITWVPFFPVPSSWKWSSLWLGAQAEGLWGLGGALLSLGHPHFSSPSLKKNIRMMLSEAKLARQCCLSQQIKQNQQITNNKAEEIRHTWRESCVELKREPVKFISSGSKSTQSATELRDGVCYCWCNLVFLSIKWWLWRRNFEGAMHKRQGRGGSVRNQPLVTGQEGAGFQIQPISYIKPSGGDVSQNLEFVWVFRKVGTQLLIVWLYTCWSCTRVLKYTTILIITQANILVKIWPNRFDSYLQRTPKC